MSLIIRKNLKIQKTKPLLKKAIEMKMSIKEHLLRFRIKEIKNTAPAIAVVLTKRLEHLKLAKVNSLSWFLKAFGKGFSRTQRWSKQKSKICLSSLCYSSIVLKVFCLSSPLIHSVWMLRLSF